MGGRKECIKDHERETVDFDSRKCALVMIVKHYITHDYNSILNNFKIKTNLYYEQIIMMFRFKKIHRRGK